MSPRQTAINFTTKELELIVNLLNRHVTVAQYYSDSPVFQLKEKLARILEIAKELEPIS